MNKQDILRLIDEEDVRFVRLQFTDILGNMRNLAITTSALEDALDGRCMFDGSLIDGFVTVEESDLYLRPCLDTFTIFPWRPHQGKVARFICDVYKPDGTRLESDPRYILQKVIKEAADMLHARNRTRVRVLPVQHRRARYAYARTARQRRLPRPCAA